MANASVTENSRNRRPTMPPISSSGIKAAISDTEIEITVKPICFAPSRVARNGEWPRSRLRNTFSIMTMASSTTKPTLTASAISDRLSIEKPAAHIAAQVPASASGTVMPAAAVAATRRRNRNTTIITRTTVAASVSCMSCTLARMVSRAVGQHRNIDTGRHPLLELRQQVVDAVDGVEHVGVALLGDDQQDGRVLVVPAGGKAVAHARLDGRDIGQPDHRAVHGLHHHRDVILRLGQLVVGGDGDVAAAAVEGAERAERVGIGDRRAHVFQRHAHGGKPARIDAHADRRLLGAGDRHVGDAVHLAEPLRDHAVGGVVDRARRQASWRSAPGSEWARPTG